MRVLERCELPRCVSCYFFVQPTLTASRMFCGHVCAVVSCACTFVSASVPVTGRVWGGAVVACRWTLVPRVRNRPFRLSVTCFCDAVVCCRSGGACPDGASVVVDDCNSTASRCTIADGSGSRCLADLSTALMQTCHRLTFVPEQTPGAVHWCVALALHGALAVSSHSTARTTTGARWWMLCGVAISGREVGVSRPTQR